MGNDKILQIVIKAKDEASKELNKFSKTIKNNQANFKKMAMAGTAVFGGLVAGIGLSVKAFGEQEKAEKRLEQIAKQVTKSTNEEIASFKNLASELQKVGVVGDEVIIAGQSQLASFTKNSKVVTELSDDLADLAVAQYGTNVSQEQSIQTANLMGKALQGQLGALTRTGILVNDDFRKAFENANTEQERAVILSQIIQDNYGGLNQAMRDTAEGGIQALKNSFGDMQETIGEVFIPILNDLVQRIAPVIESVANWVKENPELTRNIVLTGLAVSALVAGLGVLGLVIPTVITGLMLLLSPFALIPIAIGIIIAGLIQLGKVLYETRDGWFIIWNGIKDFFKETIDYLVELFDPLFAVIDRIKSAMESIGGVIKGGVSKITDKLKGKAVGGGVQIGQSYMVGERGPELFTPTGNGTITPNHKLAGTGGMNVSININGGTYLSENVAEEIGNMIIEKFKRNVRI